MALSNEGISSVRKDADEVGSHRKKLNQSSENLSNILKNNGNYQYFKAGTDKGNSVDSALNQTLTTITERLVPTINALENAIYAFLARQEEENRRAARRKIAEDKLRLQQEHNQSNQDKIINPKYRNIDLTR